MKTVILTSDNHNWLLRGFFHQWEKYALQAGNYASDPLEVEVAGYTNPGFLPENVPFVSIGNFKDYPIERWSNGVMEYLSGMNDDLIMILLEDYWLIHKINRQAIYAAHAYMMDNPDVIRFDVAADRIFSKEAKWAGSIGSIGLCEGKGDYSLSTQASIWRRKLLLELLRPGESPWQTELSGSARLNKLLYRVMGTYQWPMCYSIVVNKGKLDMRGDWMYPARRLSKLDQDSLAENGFLNNPNEPAVYAGGNFVGAQGGALTAKWNKDTQEWVKS